MFIIDGTCSVYLKKILKTERFFGKRVCWYDNDVFVEWFEVF